MREKRKGLLSEVNIRAVSRGRNELIGKFKMAAGDVISIRGQVMEYTNIPTGIKRELVRFGVVCDWKGKLSALLEEDRWPFILVEIDMLMCISLSTRNLITLIVLFKLGASM